MVSGALDARNGSSRRQQSWRLAKRQPDSPTLSLGWGLLFI
jgi:hypothetical protein